MKAYSNPYTQKVYEILEPLVGDMMARGTIKSQSTALGCNEESFKQTDIPRLAEGVKKGLVIFIGSDTASKVAAKISQIV
jgi:hypothetical protein